MSGQLQPGCLYVVATPIGNLEDITLRAVRVLREVDLVAAEDTRRARQLLTHLGLSKPTVSYFKGNEAKRSEALVGRLCAGETAALISDAGMPGLSDPGELLIRRCLDAGVPVDVIPGPSAITASLVLSGLPTGQFRFIGFLPRKGRSRTEAIEMLRRAPETTVLFEAPGRVGATLDALARALGDREAALVRELTKLHQQVVREPLGALAARYASEPPRGEVTLVIAGAPTAAALDSHALEQEVRRRLAAGERPREIADALAAHVGRRRAYQLALALRPQPPNPAE